MSAECQHPEWAWVEFVHAAWVECARCGWRPTEDEFYALAAAGGTEEPNR